MSRFRSGTTDHDGDGKMGGSMKDSEMTEREVALRDLQDAFPNDTVDIVEGVDGLWFSVAKRDQKISLRFDDYTGSGSAIAMVSKVRASL